MNFDQAFDRLLGHEGGYSDRSSAADPGGKTMWGITEAVARAHGYTGDMRALPQATAKAIYRNAYWDKTNADELPDALRFDVFDGAVNSGPVQSALWLQRAVHAVADGVIGPQTLKAIASFPAWLVASRYNGQRLQFMTERTNWADNSKGWARRIAKNLMEA